MEYYGPKPEKFTKKWWEYFWDYYKWHTITVVAIIIAVVATTVQILTQTKYDGSFVCAGNVAFPMEFEEKLVTHIENAVDDLDGDGEKNVLLEQLTFSKNDTDAQYSAAMRTKFDLKLQTNESFAFIMDEELLEQSLTNEQLEGCFSTLDEWLSEDIAEENIYSLNGVPYAVNLKDSELLREMGFSTNSFYAVLRYNYDSENEELEKQFENAKKMLNAVVKEK